MSHTACRCQGALAGAPEAGGTDALSVKSWYRKGCEVMLVSDRVSLTPPSQLVATPGGLWPLFSPWMQMGAGVESWDLCRLRQLDLCCRRLKTQSSD